MPCAVHASRSARLLALSGPLALDAVLEDPGVRLDLLQGYPLLGVEDKELLIVSHGALGRAEIWGRAK